MISLPNIFKRFMAPEHTPYEYEQAMELEVEEELHATAEEIEEREAVRASSRTPVDYAKLQAEAIMTDAKRQAEELLERASIDMQKELETLREEARQNGYRDGYSAGMASAVSELRAQREAQAVELGGMVGSFLDRAAQAREELMDQARDELRDMAIAVAEKVVRVSLKSSGEIIARMIQGATDKLKRKEWVRIYIAGCDAKSMAQAAPGLMMALAPLSDHVKIVPMADDESGTCIIEMPDEIIDASAATQIANIREALSEAN